MRFRRGLIFVLAWLFCGSLSSAQTRFSLLLNEGFGSIKIGDINTTLSSTNAAYDVLRENVPGAVSGEYLPLPTRFRDWQAELRWNVWRGLSIGVAMSGPLRFSKTNALTHTSFDGQSGLPQTMNNVLASNIHVSAPITLNVSYTMPILSRINLIVNGGIGYYKTRFEQTWSYVFQMPSDHSFVGELYTNVTGKRIGYLSVIALEYIYNKRVSLMMAGDWQFAKIKTLEGRASRYIDIFDGYGVLVDSQEGAEKGILYHWIGDADYMAVRHEKINLVSFRPEFGADHPFGIRKAFLALGGFTFRIGVKIGLF